MAKPGVRPTSGSHAAAGPGGREGSAQRGHVHYQTLEHINTEPGNHLPWALRVPNQHFTSFPNLEEACPIEKKNRTLIFGMIGLVPRKM